MAGVKGRFITCKVFVLFQLFQLLKFLIVSPQTYTTLFSGPGGFQLQSFEHLIRKFRNVEYFTDFCRTDIDAKSAVLYHQKIGLNCKYYSSFWPSRAESQKSQFDDGIKGQSV